jgi:hypothetical protein
MTERPTDRCWYRRWRRPPRWWCVRVQEARGTQRRGTVNMTLENNNCVLTPVKKKGYSNWIEEARARTEALHKRGRSESEPAAWVLTHGKTIPKGAIVTGQEHGHNLYSSRAFHEVRFLKLVGLFLSYSTCRALSVSLSFTMTIYSLFRNAVSGWKSFRAIPKRLSYRIR